MFSASKSGQYQGYQISRSVRLRSSASAYFNRAAPGASTNTIWTLSFWIKRGRLSADQNIFGSAAASNNYDTLYFNSSDNLTFFQATSGSIVWQLTPAQVFRDPSAWYHIVVAYDSAQATASNRLKMYVNGSQVTAFLVATYPALNGTSYINSSGASLGQFLGRFAASAVEYLDGYLTEVNMVTGQALTPSSFGVTNAYGVWSPTKYNGTYGTNGFYLNFSDPSAATAAAIGKDYSGNGNNWTPNNISVTAGATYDSMLDVPTPWPDGGNGRGNYCVMNPLAAQGNTVDNGNMRVTLAASLASTYGVRGTMSIRSGDKFYWEVTPTTASGIFTAIGIYDASYRFGADMGVVGSNCVLYYKSSGNKIVNGTTTAYGTTYAANDVIGIALDYSANTCTFYLNNVSQGSISLPSTSIEYIPVVGNENGVADVFQCNFGQRPFAYTPPTGFRALNTQNLPTPTIANGANYFAATTYTGTGASRSVDNTVNNVSFQPDFVWVKGRSGATDHALYDAVRGVQLQLESNTTTAETTETTGLTAFNSNGFTVGALAQMNTNTATYVGWQWKEGATQGFDIVTYTGNSTASRSISHSLGVTPSMIIVKNRSAVQNWPVAHTSLATGNLLTMDTTQASTAAGTRLRLGNSSSFTVGDAADYGITNQTGQNYVAYCFAAIAGFSAFGSYTGNGSTDGTFVFLGFRPRWILIKRTDSAGYSWLLHDTARSPENPSDELLVPNTSSAESTAAAQNIDFVSNGFKLRTSDAFYNASGGTYIFAAFAENPFKYSLAR